MKRVLSVLCVAVLLVSMMALAGCGLDGTYKLVEANYQGQVLSSEMLTQAGLSGTLVIKGEVATLTTTTNGQTNTGTSKIDTKNKMIIDSDGKSLPFTVDGKRISMTVNVQSSAIQMTFEKQ